MFAGRLCLCFVCISGPPTQKWILVGTVEWEAFIHFIYYLLIGPFPTDLQTLAPSNGTALYSRGPVGRVITNTAAVTVTRTTGKNREAGLAEVNRELLESLPEEKEGRSYGSEKMRWLDEGIGIIYK